MLPYVTSHKVLHFVIWCLYIFLNDLPISISINHESSITMYYQYSISIFKLINWWQFIIFYFMINLLCILIFVIFNLNICMYWFFFLLCSSVLFLFFYSFILISHMREAFYYYFMINHFYLFILVLLSSYFDMVWLFFLFLNHW